MRQHVEADGRGRRLLRPALSGAFLALLGGWLLGCSRQVELQPFQELVDAHFPGWTLVQTPRLAGPFRYVSASVGASGQEVEGAVTQPDGERCRYRVDGKVGHTRTVMALERQASPRFTYAVLERRSGPAPAVPGTDAR